MAATVESKSGELLIEKPKFRRYQIVKNGLEFTHDGISSGCDKNIKLSVLKSEDIVRLYTLS